MAKTLSTILTVASIAALAAVTAGVGASVALGYSVGTGLSYTAAALGVSSGLLASTALVGLQNVLGAFKGSPKVEQTYTALKTERPIRVSAYGRLKLFGAYNCYETSSDGYAVDGWVYHDGQIDGIEGWYLGDRLVTRLPSGFVQKGEDNRYGDSNIIQIGANLGLPIETAHQPMIDKLPGIWTADHRGDGCVTGYMISQPVKAKNYQETYADGGPNATPLGLIMRAQLVFDWRDSTQSVADPRTWKWSENSWLHIAHYDLVRQSIGPTRPPSDSGYWSDIAALYSARWDARIAPTLAYWTAAANDADVAMPLKGGSSEPRYRSCVSHKHTDAHKAVMATMLATCDGWISVRQDGALVAYSGRYYAPSVTLGPDQIVSYTIEDGIEDENALNSLGVTYISAAHDFNQVDTDPWTDEDDILSRGALRPDDFNPQTPSHSQNRRLAKRKMAQVMARRRGTFVTVSGSDGVLSERFINLDLTEGQGTEDEFAPYVGPVEITGLSRNLQTGSVTGSWIQADINIDSWNPATEEGNPAPSEDRVAREPLDAPAIISATAMYSAVGTTPEGDEPIDPTPGQTATGARVLIASTGPDRADLTWYARWRVGTSGSWNEREYADADPGPGVSFQTEFVPLATNINVEVAYSVGDGRLSDWSNPAVVNTTTV